ncbi:hypothetical protein D6777_04460 [Candidatus Woesearchaeota archaeon]|nr:MAG: hypothetical protein D6777_04460 [Candidatus Woesearchaeota archaeon]
MVSALRVKWYHVMIIGILLMLQFSMAEDGDGGIDQANLVEEDMPPTCAEIDDPVCVVANCNNEFLSFGMSEDKVERICSAVISGATIYRYKDNGAMGDGAIFPASVDGEIIPLKTRNVQCANPLAIKLAWLDPVDKTWKIIDESEAKYVNEEDKKEIQVEAMFTDSGFKQVMQSYQGPYYISVIEERRPYTEDDLCVKTDCPRGQMFYTTDEHGDYFDAKVVDGVKLKVNVCPSLTDCNPEADGVCDKACTQNVDPDCGACTPAEGDCCDLTGEGICDTDCGEADPDCLCSEKKDDCCSGKKNDPDCVAETDKNPEVSYDKSIVVPEARFRYIKSYLKVKGDFQSPYPEIEVSPNVQNCDYRIDGKCDPNCLSYKIYGVKFNSFKEAETLEEKYEPAVVTRYVDADCCQLTKTTEDGELVTGLAAAENVKDGCCKAACDGVCDPDCLVGQDPDCSIGEDFKKSMYDIASDVATAYDLKAEDFVEGYTDAKCMGCGNGVCEYNVWGGGRIDRPYIPRVGGGTYKNFDKEGYENLDYDSEYYLRTKSQYYLVGEWEITPSIYDIAKFNWNYLKQLKENNNDPLAIHPFYFLLRAINRWYPPDHGYNPLPSAICFKNNWIYDAGRFKGDCNVLLYPTENGYKATSYIREVEENHNSIVYNNIFSGDELNKVKSFFDEKLTFTDGKTFYPYDENPDNCPQDCGDLCGDGVCQPWEKAYGSCSSDCNEDVKKPLAFYMTSDDDFKDKKEGQLIFKKRLFLPIDYAVYQPFKNADGKDEGIYDAEGFLSGAGERARGILNDTRPLCMFSTPGEQGNCPSGSVCGYYGECIAIKDFKLIAEKVNEMNEDHVTIGNNADDFYKSLANFVDKDLDTFFECDDPLSSDKCDCDDENTRINPDAIDVCDGVDNDCDGLVDNVKGGDAGSSCEQALLLCQDKEENVVQADENNNSKLDCFLSMCKWNIGDSSDDDKGRLGKVIYCSIDTTNMEIGKHEYYIYTCNPNENKDKCNTPIKAEFEVCKPKEDICIDNVDNDCDGLIDKDDPDCFQCNPDENAPDKCRLTTKEWCRVENGEPALTTEDYCNSDACGMVDSSCSEGAQACAENELSCGRGCRPGACDIDQNLTCNDNGVWLSANYVTNCGGKDSQFSDTCEENACDYVTEYTCLNSQWRASGGGYCTHPLACGGKYDSSCNGECVPGSCDTQENKYCTDQKTWSSEDYCQHCGYTDADCGVRACKEGACDYANLKKCVNGVWTEQMSEDDYCQACPWPENLDPNFICHQPQCENPDETETSCVDNVDNDCDGLTDCEDTEDCDPTSDVCVNPPCVPGEQVPCGSNIGLCEQGVKTCKADGTWGECVGSIGPKFEICNSFDDDCDDSIDENCVGCNAGELRPCGTNTGACSTGVQKCNPETGKWSTCYGNGYVSAVAQTEVCDGVDNDCDGQVDEECGCEEGATQACGEDNGECKQGTQKCVNGRWSECTGGKGPLPEICSDGLDNDCDGLVDNADIDCDPSKVDKPSLPTCYDAVQNQGEEGIDCGGPCESCEQVTCTNQKWDGDETGLDCGGSKCPPCKGEKPKVVEEEEEEEEDECGDGYCGDTEDEDTCPEDCAQSSPVVKIIIFVVLFLILGIGGYVVFKNIKSGRRPLDLTMFKQMFAKKEQQPQQTFNIPQQTVQQQPRQTFAPRPVQRKKKIVSKEQEALEKSFKESEELFK